MFNDEFIFSKIMLTILISEFPDLLSWETSAYRISMLDKSDASFWCFQGRKSD
jgi:hypothetical protein